MRNIKFEFSCSRPVPLYAHLCNQYLHRGSLDIKIGFHNLTYFIEAKGDLHSLEVLADSIAQDFLISVWLIDAKITLLESSMGTSKHLDNAKIEQEFCQQCVPQFGDNQSLKFGELSLHCECCHGSNRLQEAHIGLSYLDISSMLEILNTKGTIKLPGKPSITLSLTSLEKTDREQLLICNPNTINALFYLKKHDVLALSSIEKPWIMARPINDQPKLTEPLYNIRFAHSRLLIVLCERLKQHGTDWVYYSSEETEPALVRLHSAWSQIRGKVINKQVLLPFHKLPTPLHEKASAYNITATCQYTEISCNQHSAEAESLADSLEISPQDAAVCALHAGILEHKQKTNIAVIYLSQHYNCQILTLNNKRNIELFFTFPDLPSTGYNIYYQLEQSPHKQVVEKFKHKYPQDYLRLLDLKFTGPTNNFSTLWAIAATILGLPSKKSSKDALNDALMSAAMSHGRSNSPRIDYPLIKNKTHKGLNWCKTLGSLISFRLADDSNNPSLAFGMFDSLADFIANWIEHLDRNIGIHSLILAGDELANPILSHRLSLRLGNNFPLNVNRQLDIDGNNIAIGGLYLKKRRRYLSEKNI
ncbi:MAG: NiFe hydrogenase [Shewanella sp.]